MVSCSTVFMIAVWTGVDSSGGTVGVGVFDDKSSFCVFFHCS